MKRASVLLALVVSLLFSWMHLVTAQDRPDSRLLSLLPGPSGLADVPQTQSVRLRGHVGGSATAVAVQGIYAYVTCGSRLVILDISNPTHPTMIGQSVPMPGLGQAIALTGNHAYVAAGTGGMWIINVADPTHPTQAGLYVTPWFARNVAVSGNYAYLTVQVYSGPPPGGGLQIVDVSDPMHPIGIAWCDAGYSSYDGVAVVGRYVYYAAGSLRILDVSDPAHPVQVGSYMPPFSALDVQVVGNYAYIAATSGLYVINISDPTNPTLAGNYDVPGYGSGQYYCRVAVEGHHAYLADQEDRLYVLDVSNPAQPTQAGFYSTPGYTYDLAVAGDKMYLAKDRARYAEAHWLGGSLYIVNVSNPAQPVEAGVYQTWGSAEGISLSAGHAYVADRDGVHIVNVSTPTSPKEVSFYDTTGAAYDVAAEGSHACVGDGAEGLRVLNVSDPLHPSEAGFYDTPGDATYVAKAGDYAYVIDHNLGLRIISLSDPAHPSEVGFYNMPTPRDLVVVGHYVYIINQWELHVVDVADPALPTQVGVCPDVAYTRRIAVTGDYAYITAYGNVSGVKIVNISDPTRPTLIAFYQSGSPRGIAAEGQLIFVGVGTTLQVMDVSRPQRPTVKGLYSLPEVAYDVGLHGEEVYVAAGRGGLFVLQYLPYRMLLPLVVRNPP